MQDIEKTQAELIDMAVRGEIATVSADLIEWDADGFTQVSARPNGRMRCYNDAGDLAALGPRYSLTADELARIPETGTRMCRPD